MERLELYLQSAGYSTIPNYVNTEHENDLVNKFMLLYTMSLSAQQQREDLRPETLEKYRKAYAGTLNALKSDGTESERKSRPLRKLVYELIESKVDNSVPMPSMKARYKTDLPRIDITENYLKFEVDDILSKYNNDQAERDTYIDGTMWYKVWWDSLSRTHERSGNVKIDICRVDQIVPQPYVNDYKQLEYIFEKKDISSTRLYDLYGRMITGLEGNSNVVHTISCYYLNENRIVGLFMWCPETMQVICNEKDWQIRKIRYCTYCNTVVPQSTECPVCSHTNFKFKNATTDILDEDLMEVYNPYEVGETDDANQDQLQMRPFLSKGTEIPYYQLTQLPFVPRPAVSELDSIYGVSDVKMVLEMQDLANKILTKAADKTLKSGVVVTKPDKIKLDDDDETFKILDVKTAEQAQMVAAKQILADTTEDIVMANLMYDSAKSTSGITDSFQGKRDTTATSGKAKQWSVAQSAGRLESTRVMKAAAFSGVYELVFKYLLAFSDEKRKFVKILPDGNQEEMVWNKYMFLEKDEHGDVYYRDDFSFNCDHASSLTQNKQAMWQETQDKFINGAFGNPQDPRVLKLFWNIMDSFQYPLAKIVLAGIADYEQHIPPEMEQAIMENPELQQIIQASMTSGQGGARPNSGPQGNGATHSANVERTNERNRSQNREVATSAQQAAGGGVE